MIEWIDIVQTVFKEVIQVQIVEHGSRVRKTAIPVTNLLLRRDFIFIETGVQSDYLVFLHFHTVLERKKPAIVTVCG
jgi:hypothetical protein